MKKKKLNTELLVKTIVFAVSFILTMLILSFTPLPNEIKNIMSTIGADVYEPPVRKEWSVLFVYRLLIYFLIPVVVTIVELIFIKRKRKAHTLLLNLEAQFLGFTVISGLFYLFALDYVFKADIFSIKDSIMSLLLFILTLTLDKNMPHVFLTNDETNN